VSIWGDPGLYPGEDGPAQRHEDAKRDFVYQRLTAAINLQSTQAPLYLKNWGRGRGGAFLSLAVHGSEKQKQKRRGGRRVNRRTSRGPAKNHAPTRGLPYPFECERGEGNAVFFAAYRASRIAREERRRYRNYGTKSPQVKNQILSSRTQTESALGRGETEKRRVSNRWSNPPPSVGDRRRSS